MFLYLDDDLTQSERVAGIDLNCKEHVSDSETDSQSEEEALIENKAFPQQRFSPVMRPLSSTDITYRPKPMLVKPEPQLKIDLAMGSAAVVSERAALHVTRPSSSGSSVFHPTGAVFKAHMPRLRDNVVDPTAAKMAAGVSSVASPGALQRSYSVDSSETRPRGGSQVKTIHNITMMTQPDKRGIILSTNTQVALGQHNRHGVVLSKITQKGPKGLPKTVSMTGGSTMRGVRPQVGPIAIASKPVMPMPPLSASPATPTVCVNPAGVALNVHPHVVAPSAATILKAPITAVSAASRPSHENIAAALVNAPIALKSLSCAQVAPPRVQAAPAGLVTNFILKPGMQATPDGATNIQTLTAPVGMSRAPPTPVQYILPSFTLQAGPNGKVQNILQMAMPNAQLHAGSIQLAIPNQSLLQQPPAMVAQPQLMNAKFQVAQAPVTMATPTIQQKLISLNQQTLQMVNPNPTLAQPAPSPSHPIVAPRFMTLSHPGQILSMGQQQQLQQPAATRVVSLASQQMLTTSGLSHFTLVNSQSQALAGIQSPRILLPTTNK